ncbi:MAG: type II secretion system protein GspG [Spirochaetales bacterium]|nr:type II secretion system protein GspG [Spirochaetales bacterium]
MERTQVKFIKLFCLLPIMFLFTIQSFSSTNSGRAKADLLSFKTAIDAYRMDNIFHYPDKQKGLRALIKYLDGQDIPLDPWGHGYIYVYPSLYSDGAYDLYSIGKNGIDEKGEGDDISAWKDIPQEYFMEIKILPEFLLIIFFVLLIGVFLAFLLLHKKLKTKPHIRGILIIAMILLTTGIIIGLNFVYI